MTAIVLAFEARRLRKTARLSFSPGEQLGELLAALTPQEKLAAAAIRLVSDKALGLYGHGLKRRERDNANLLELRKAAFAYTNGRFPLSPRPEGEQAWRQARDVDNSHGTAILLGAYVGNLTNLAEILQSKALATVGGMVPLTYHVPPGPIDPDVYEELADRLEFRKARSRKYIDERGLHLKDIRVEVSELPHVDNQALV